jgi:hypothetical protein
MIRRLPGKRGPIDDDARSALHRALDQIVGLRNMEEAGVERFHRLLLGASEVTRVGIDASLRSQYFLHQRALDLAETIFYFAFNPE